MSKKKLTLEFRPDHPSGVPHYLVKRVIGSVEPYPGEVLNKARVHDLCQMTGMWEVTIIGWKAEES